jgi:hypothetical protein
MRTLLAIAIFMGGAFALNPTADAARKFKRAKVYYYAAPPRYLRRSACARTACGFDPAGEFRGFPGWARKAFNNLRN